MGLRIGILALLGGVPHSMLADEQDKVRSWKMLAEHLNDENERLCARIPDTDYVDTTETVVVEPTPGTVELNEHVVPPLTETEYLLASEENASRLLSSVSQLDAEKAVVNIDRLLADLTLDEAQERFEGDTSYEAALSYLKEAVRYANDDMIGQKELAEILQQVANRLKPASVASSFTEILDYAGLEEDEYVDLVQGIRAMAVKARNGYNKSILEQATRVLSRISPEA